MQKWMGFPLGEAPSVEPPAPLVIPPPKCQASPPIRGGNGQQVTVPLCDIPLGCCSGRWALGPGQSPVLPFACCVGSLRSVGRCDRCPLVSFPRSRSPVVGVPGLC